MSTTFLAETPDFAADVACTLATRLMNSNAPNSSLGKTAEKYCDKDMLAIATEITKTEESQESQTQKIMDAKGTVPCLGYGHNCYRAHRKCTVQGATTEKTNDLTRHSPGFELKTTSATSRRYPYLLRGHDRISIVFLHYVLVDQRSAVTGYNTTELST